LASIALDTMADFDTVRRETQLAQGMYARSLLAESRSTALPKIAITELALPEKLS